MIPAVFKILAFVALTMLILKNVHQNSPTVHCIFFGIWYSAPVQSQMKLFQSHISTCEHINKCATMSQSGFRDFLKKNHLPSMHELKKEGQ